ncbi:MAG: hypothetical protein PHW47_06715 [Lachnospira sp.]|nr:hypothetical protein [Lachnospira sp.]
MNMNTFFSPELLGVLALISFLTVVTVEALKKMFKNIKLYNAMAIVSAMVWTFIVALSVLFTGGTVVTPQVILYWCIVGILSAVISMIGYDKFMQMLSQAGDNNER